MSVDNERYAEESIPSDYASWRYCIEVKCNLALTPDFIKARIAVFGDPQNEESQRFAKMYGDPWREQVLTWFQRAASEV